MDITLSGKLYVYFIRSIFENNQKIGYEFIININKSDNTLIDGLSRLKKINKNIIYFNINDIKIPIKIYDKKYICNISIMCDTNNKLILNDITDIIYDIPEKIVNRNIKIHNYSTNKNKTIQQIMNIIEEH
jgi:hypothetical protein